MMIIVGFLVAIAAIGGLFYVLVIYREIPGAVEQRLGVLEALPENVGKWRVDEDSDEGKAAIGQGLKREVRVYHDPSGGGILGGGRLIRQVRYRNRATNAIARIEPDEVLKRKRVKS